MQRPTRILVFGVLCLVFGGFSLLHNLNQLGVAVGGPEAMQVPTADQAPGQLGQMMRDTAKAMRGALDAPVYRAGLGLKSALNAAMAGLLIGVGIGLLRDRLWALRLARVWAVYAIVAAGVTVLLQSLYVVPNIPAASQASGSMAGAQYAGMALMLIVMCIFPVLLLTVLPKKNVLAYLRDRDTASASPSDSVLNDRPGDRPGLDRSATNSATDINPGDTTWRDDPWNDPPSR